MERVSLRKTSTFYNTDLSYIYTVSPAIAEHTDLFFVEVGFSDLQEVICSSNDAIIISKISIGNEVVL